DGCFHHDANQSHARNCTSTYFRSSAGSVVTRNAGGCASCCSQRASSACACHSTDPSCGRTTSGSTTHPIGGGAEFANGKQDGSIDEIQRRINQQIAIGLHEKNSGSDGAK